MSNERDNLGSTKMVSRTRRISPARVASRVAKAVNARDAGRPLPPPRSGAGSQKGHREHNFAHLVSDAYKQSRVVEL